MQKGKEGGREGKKKRREKGKKKEGEGGRGRERGKGKKGRILIYPSGPLKQHNLLAIESIAHHPVGQGILIGL